MFSHELRLKILCLVQESQTDASLTTQTSCTNPGPPLTLSHIIRYKNGTGDHGAPGYRVVVRADRRPGKAKYHLKIPGHNRRSPSPGKDGPSGENKRHHIPACLRTTRHTYTRHKERRVEWFDWQTKGLVFSSLSEGFSPFCTRDSRVNDESSQI